MPPRHGCVALCVALGVCLALGLCAAQTCEPYALSITESAICSGRQSYYVWVPPGLTQKQAYEPLFIKSFGKGAGSSNVLKIFQQAPPRCLAAFAALICGILLPGCSNPLIPFPSPICSSVCTSVLTTCGPVISALVNINCSATHPITTLPLFIPDNTTQTVPLGNITIELGCYTPLADAVCSQWGLPSTALPGFCSPKCRYGFFRKHKQRATTTTLLVLSWIEFPLNLFVCLSYLLDPEKRRYPVIYPLFIAVSNLLNNLTFMVASIVGVTTILCKDPSRINTPHTSGLCAVSGVVNSFTAVAGGTWIVVMMLSLIYFLFVGTYPPRWTQIPAHIFAWGLPMSVNIYGLSKNEPIGSYAATAVCGYQDTADVVVFFPYVISHAVAVVLVLIVVLRIVSITGFKGLEKQRQLLVFVLCLSILSLQAIVTRVYTRPRTTAKILVPPFYRETNCVTNNKFGIAGPNVTLPVRCYHPEPANYNIFALTFVCTTIGFALPFLFFGLTRQNLHFWKALLKVRSWDQLYSSISSSSSSHGSPVGSAGQSHTSSNEDGTGHTGGTDGTRTVSGMHSL